MPRNLLHIFDDEVLVVILPPFPVFLFHVTAETAPNFAQRLADGTFEKANRVIKVSVANMLEGAGHVRKLVATNLAMLPVLNSEVGEKLLSSLGLVWKRQKGERSH